MVSRILEIAMLGCLAAAALFGALALWRTLRWPRKHCPGNASRWVTLVLPWRWVWRAPCGYDLRGLPILDHGPVRCPECGRVCTPQGRVRWTVAFQPVGATLAAASCALACFLAGRAYIGQWTWAAPTLALPGLERQLPTRFSRHARRELDDRIYSGDLSPWQARAVSRALLANLWADRWSGNATRAKDRLATLWPHSREALTLALASDDRQSRLLACAVLRTKLDEPTESLLRVTLEDLADDRRLGYLSQYNANEAVQYLRRYPDLATPHLEWAMRHGDWQQRLVCAAVSVRQAPGLRPLAVPILVEHLGDNAIENDAQFALYGLVACGPVIADALEPYRYDADPQRRQTCRALLARFGRPTDAAEPSLDRAVQLSEHAFDPFAGLPNADYIRVYRLYRR